MVYSHKYFFGISMLGAIALTTGTVRAGTTPDPGDYNPAPAGTDVGLLYLQRQYADDVYAHGDKVSRNVGLGLDLAILRNVSYFQLGDLPADWQVILPMARQHTDLTGSTLKGIGDLTVGGTVWTVSHPEKSEYLGWSAFLTGPTGGHSDEGIAVSNDRYALDLQTGYTRSLGDPWTMDLVGQVELYTKSSDTRIKTDPMYRVFASLRYGLTGNTFLEGIVRQTWGEHEDQYGQVLQSSMSSTNLTVGINSAITKRFQVQVQLSDDVHAQNGARFKALQTRFGYAF